MSTFFPDNPNREARVRQVITQTTTIQAGFVNIEENINKNNDDAAKLLVDLARYAGYPSVEEYCQAGIEALPESQKNLYKDLAANLIKYNQSMKTSLRVSGAVAALGMSLNMGTKLLTGIVCKFSAFVRGMQGILRGLILMIKGAFQDGCMMVKTFATLIKTNWSRALVVGEKGADMSVKVAGSLRWLRRAGKLLSWAGIFAEIGLLVWDAIEGANQKTELQAAITETVSTRFGVKKIELLLSQSSTWNSRLTGVVQTKHFYEKKMREQELKPPPNPAMRITQEQIDEDVKNSLMEMVDAFDQELANCSTDERALGQLALLDQSDSSGDKAWTAEDPSIEKIHQWIHDHPFKDQDGKEVPLDGPAIKNVGLDWKCDPIKAKSANTTLVVTGENRSEKAQEFKKINFQFFVSKRETAVFEGWRFAKQGRGDSTDGWVEFVVGDGVKNVGEELPTRWDERLCTIVATALPADASQPIYVPHGATVKFQVTGRTTGAGTSASLVTTDYFPSESLYSDVIIKKE